MKALPKSFYLQDAYSAARDLLGKLLVREFEGKCYSYKIVETESYMGIEDKAAHVYGDKRTPRTATIYEAGGVAYIYLIYGMYSCLNIVVNKKEVPQCVLIRALEPIDEAAMAFARGNRPKAKKVTQYTNGPGKLTKALAIDKTLNGCNVKTRGALWIAENNIEEPIHIVEATRIGIDYAEEYKDKLWRFYIEENPFVSVIGKK